ncbi:hypothetical protein HZ989_06785 [Brevundimonas sp. AJA228-03]|uniref:hypothetical protein n=1 Tax=Brevundimonas sp. AJA228-03 TaxID=2752515 RepID=UPI001ADFAE83|nr:hypothetical protein [Brevundimonas sp. AJA228-03]QTN20744.1 hypothetical protein HZ989_06785 [Brevundimonas sp. AJA228-03]
MLDVLLAVVAISGSPSDELEPTYENAVNCAAVLYLRSRYDALDGYVDLFTVHINRLKYAARLLAPEIDWRSAASSAAVDEAVAARQLAMREPVERAMKPAVDSALSNPEIVPSNPEIVTRCLELSDHLYEFTHELGLR